MLALERLGIEVEYHHEVGPSQHEIDMRYSNSALKMADDCMTYRITVKEYALVRLAREFMPKPLFGRADGYGMHTHQSLFKDGATRTTTPTTSTSY